MEEVFSARELLLRIRDTAFASPKEVIGGAVIALIPVVNLLLLGISIRAVRAQLRHEQMSLSPARELIRDSLMGLAVLVVMLGVPVVVLAGISALMEVFQPGAFGLVLLLALAGVAFVTFMVMLWCLPLAVASIAEGKRDALRVFRKAFTKRYAQAMLGIVLLWVAVMAALTVVAAVFAFTLVIPLLAAGLGLWIAYVGMGVLMAWFLEQEPQVVAYRKRKGKSFGSIDYEIKEMQRAIDRLKIS